MTCNSSVQTFEKCLIKSKCIGFEMQFAVLNKNFHISLVWIILFIFTLLGETVQHPFIMHCTETMYWLKASLWIRVGINFIGARAFRDNFDIDGNVKVNLNFKWVDDIIADHLFQ